MTSGSSAISRGVPSGDLAPEVQDHDALGQRLDERLHVLDEDDGHAAAVHAVDELGDLVDLMRHQAGGHLVEEQDPRLERERARHLKPLEVEQWQRPRAAGGAVDEPAQLEDLVHLVGAGRGAGARVGGDEQVLADSHPGERARDLMGAGDPQARDRMRAHPVDPVGAVEDDLARGRSLGGVDEAEQRALAGAVGADHAEQLARGDVAREVVERRDAAEALGQVAQRQRCRLRARARGSRLRDDLAHRPLTLAVVCMRMQNPKSPGRVGPTRLNSSLLRPSAAG